MSFDPISSNQGKGLPSPNPKSKSAKSSKEKLIVEQQLKQPKDDASPIIRNATDLSPVIKTPEKMELEFAGDISVLNSMKNHLQSLQVKIRTEVGKEKRNVKLLKQFLIEYKEYDKLTNEKLHSLIKQLKGFSIIAHEQDELQGPGKFRADFALWEAKKDKLASLETDIWELKLSFNREREQVTQIIGKILGQRKFVGQLLISDKQMKKTKQMAPVKIPPEEKAQHKKETLKKFNEKLNELIISKKMPPLSEIPIQGIHDAFANIIVQHVKAQLSKWQPAKPQKAIQTRYPNTEETKVGKVAGVTRPFLVVKLSEGKDKNVYGVRGIIGGHRPKIDSTNIDYMNVFYTPQPDIILSSHRKIIDAEQKIQADIAESTYARYGVIETNLALDMDEMGGSGVFEAPRAEGNLEKKMQMADLPTCISYGSQFLNGMRILHSTDHVHGDLKPENCLVFPDGTVRISDFGKATKVKGDKEAGLYDGNTRFGPPKGKKSKNGDVYGAGLCLIRLLESSFLDKGKPLISADTKGKLPAHESRTGLEQFITADSRFQRTCETKGTGWIGMVQNFLCKVKTQLGIVKLQDEQTALNQYIDTLCGKLSGLHQEEKVAKLKVLLKEMTDIDASKRPSMEDALQRYHEIFPDNTVTPPTPPLKKDLQELGELSEKRERIFNEKMNETKDEMKAKNSLEYLEAGDKFTEKIQEMLGKYVKDKISQDKQNVIDDAFTAYLADELDTEAMLNILAAQLA